MKDDDEGSGFGDRWTDICDCRVASATEKDSRMTQKFGFFFLGVLRGPTLELENIFEEEKWPVPLIE